MKNVSRADLLRVLCAETKGGFELDKNELAQLFQFNYQQDRLPVSIEKTDGVEKVSSSSTDIPLPNLYPESKAYRYWYVDEWQVQADETTVEEIAKHSLKTAEPQQLVQHPAITTNYFINIWYPIEI